MVARRARPVIWPAKLLWAPLLLVGLPLMMHIQGDSQRVASGTWRVVLTIPAPPGWVGHPATFWPGLLLLLLGLTALILYLREARPGTWTAVEHPWFAVAAWLLLAVAALATFRITRQVASFTELGIDWRFLAHARTHWLDRVTLGLALAGGAACWLLSWGLPPVEPRQNARTGQPQQGPTHPRA